MGFFELLSNNAALLTRKNNTDEQITTIRAAFQEKFESTDDLAVYCAGSLGRGDVGKKSDLDVFIISANDKRSYINDLKVYAKIIEINDHLNYPEFSNDGQYLKIYPITKMLAVLGQPADDSENMFTARMLLLLESKAIYGDNLYQEYIQIIIDHYFRDRKGHSKFLPTFLVNDLLRYWRTLCLNYEKIRNDIDRPWYKKNINLKFSRMITVFGTVLPIISNPNITQEEVLSLTALSPLERFSKGLDKTNCKATEEDFNNFLSNYEDFLCWKEIENMDSKMKDPKLKEETRQKAEQFSDFIYDAVCSCDINKKLKKLLVI